MLRWLAMGSALISVLGALLIMALFAWIGWVLAVGGLYSRSSLPDANPQSVLVASALVLLGLIPLGFALDLTRHIWMRISIPMRLINLVWFVSIIGVLGLLALPWTLFHPDFGAKLPILLPFALYALGVVGAYKFRQTKKDT